VLIGVTVVFPRPRTTRESFATLRDDIDDLSARLAEAEASANALPHRRKYLLLVVEFLGRQLELHLELVDEVERELDPQRRGDAPTPRRRSGGH
jgi:hypothetical protein